MEDSKKQLLLTFILSIHLFACFGQTNYGFADGTIITKKNDTLRCLVEMAVTYGEKISYKLNAGAPALKIASEEIHSIKTPNMFYENILLGKKERLMSLLVDGDAKLFAHVTINVGTSKTDKVGTTTLYGAPTVVYGLKKDNLYHEVKKKTFVETINATLADCSSIVAKVNEKVYRFEDLEKVVNEYNACK